MHFMECLRIALHCMRAGRLRTVLTMLGIVISVSLVIVVSAINSWVVNGYRTSLGNLVSVMTVSMATSVTPGGNGSRRLNDADVEALRDEIDSSTIDEVAPVVQGFAVIRSSSEVYRGTVIGSSPNYLMMTESALAVGSMFTEEQYRVKARVTVLAADVASRLFGGDGDNALGESVQIGRHTFRVVGVLRQSGRGDSSALTPITTARTYLLGGSNLVTAVALRAATIDRFDRAVAEVKGVLDQRHFVKESGERDYSIMAAQDYALGIVQIVELLRIFLLILAMIALFIGTVGLANVMLITVTERTHEVGIRKAIGAGHGAIMRQFLIESVLIAAVGGIIGVLLGVAFTWIGGGYLTAWIPMWSAPEPSGTAILGAFLSSLIVGLIAGCYPALRASRLQPIDAIRH